MITFRTLLSKVAILLLITAFHTISNAQLSINFSHQRGFYEAPFNLTITTTEAATIKYTLNGSRPTFTGADVPNLIPVNSTTVVRVLAYNGQDTIQQTHTYLFLNEIINQSNNSVLAKGYPDKWGFGPAKFPNGTIVDQSADYGMDQLVTNNAAYSAKLKEGLRQIPTLSLSLHMDSLFHPDKGIYSNSLEEYESFFLNNDALIEKPVSIEMFNGDGTTEFHTFAGLKMNGASTRHYDFYKHAFRLVFRKKFGDGKLDHDLYGGNAAKDHQSLVLRMIGHCSPHDWQQPRRDKTQFQRDKFARDLYRKMGHLSPNSKYVHLYLNGIYWGLYDITERVDGDYLSEYLGGSEDEYDVIKQLKPTDGDTVTYYKLFDFSNNSSSGRVETAAQFDSIAYYVDLPAFADYILLNHYLINSDWNSNNWIAARRKKTGAKFKFFVWDAEFVLFDKLYQNLVVNYQDNLSPAGLHRDLEEYREYQIIFGDRYQCNCVEEDGVLHNTVEDFLALEASINNASLAELARWGDVRGTLVDYDNDIVPTREEIANETLPGRLEFLSEIYSRSGYSLYSKIEAVQFSHLGGLVNQGFQVDLSNPNNSGDIYYTLDGTDPRESGGGLSPNAMLYTGPIIVDDFALISARVYNPGNFNPQYNWSAMCPRQFFTNESYTIVINEIQYNPLEVVLADGTVIDGDEFEFIEMKNTGNRILDLSNVFFSSGIDYTFPVGSTLGPNEFWVIAENPSFFNSTYNFEPNDKYSGKLSNGGEALILNDPGGSTIDIVNYNDKRPWPVQPDGNGPSLSLMAGFESQNQLYSSWAGSVFCTPNEENVFCQPITFNTGINGIGCEISPNASISVAPDGGITPYTYSWSTGSTNNTITNIIEGQYAVNITDNQGCSYREEIEVIPPYIGADLLLQGKTKTGIYQVANQIISAGRVYINSNVSFKADTILLINGFSVDKKANLCIDIDPCD